MRFCLASIWLVLAAGATQAQTYVWNGGTGAGPHSWNTNGNWSLAGFPNASGVTASIISDWSAAPTINLNQAITVGNLFLDDGGSSNDVGVTIAANGGSLTFNNGGSTAAVLALGSATHTISANVTLTNGLSGGAASGTTLHFSGAISGSGGINLTQPGTVILSNVNSFSGTTTISSGTLQIGNGGSIGSVSSASIVNNSSLVVNRSDNVLINSTISGSGSVTHNGSGLTAFGAGNSYSGGTFLNSGILRIGSGGTTGSIQGDVVNNSHLQFDRSDDLTFTFDISGTGQLTKLGAGTLILTGANTYTGNTVVTNGILAIGPGGSLASSAISVNTGSIMRFSHDGTLTYSGAISGNGSLLKGGSGTTILTGACTHSGGTTIDSGVLQIGNGGTTGSIAGDVVNNSILTFNRSDALTFAGVISGSGMVVKNGAGTLILTGTNSYSGNTNINAGILQIGSGGTAGSIASTTINNNAALAFNRSDSITYSGAIGGTGNLTQSGTGTLILTGTNSYTGGTTISAGTLQIGSGGTAGSITGDVLNNSAFVVNREGTLTLDGVISGTGSLTKQGSGTLILTGANTYSGGTTISGGSLQIGNGGTTGSVTGNITNNAGVTFNRSDDVTFAGTITGSGSLLKDGAGKLTLTADNSYTGGNLILNGTLQIGSGGATGSVAGDIGNFGVLIFNRSGTVDFNGVISLSGTLTQQGPGTLRLGGANTYTGLTTVSGGALTIGTGGATGSISGNVLNNAILIFNRTADYTYAGNITGSGSIFKVNSNTLTLTGTNTYTGATNLQGGMVIFSSASSLGSGGAITFDGGTLRWGGGNTADLSSRTITINSGGATLDTNVNNVTFANAIGNSSTGALTKAGTGTLILAGNNTYTGGTTISAGVLQIGNGGTSGSVVGNIVNNSGLTFNRSDDFTYAGVISGTGSLLKDGGGTLTFTGDHTFTNTTLINNGTLRLGDGGSSGSLAGDIGNLSALVFNRSGTLDYSGVISGNGTVTKQGSGTVRLGGANTYTGTTTVSGGVLTIGTGGATGSIVSDVVNNSTLIFNRTTDYTYAGDISGSGSIFKVNSNTLTLTGTNTYAGTTNIEGGVLEFSSLSNLGSGGTLRFGGGMLRWAPGNTADISTRTVFLDAGGGNLNVNFNHVTLANAIGNAGTGALTKTGLGILTLLGENTYTGSTTINAGALRIGNGGTTGSILSSSVIVNATLIFNRSDNISFAGVISGSGTLIHDGTGILTLSNDSPFNGSTVFASTLRIGAGGTTGSLGNGEISNYGQLVFDRSNDSTFSGSISETGSVTKQGGGTLTLTGSNTYTGGTNLNAGTLELGSSGAIGSSGTISFGGGTLRFTASNTTDYSSRFSTAAGQAYSLHTNSQNVTLATALTSSGGTLTKSGDGILTLTGNNTFAGTTTVNAGILRIGNGGTTGSLASTSIVLSSGALIFNRSDDLTYAGVISGTGTMTKSGAGTLTLTGANTSTGTLFINAGTLQIGSGGTTGSVNAAIQNNSALIFNRSDSVTHAANINGPGTLAKQGLGTLTLSGTNSYSGGTTISNGTLRLGSSGAIGSTGTVTFGGGILEFSASNTTDYSSRFSTAAGQNYRIQLASQNVTFATGLTSVGGTLRVTGPGSLTLTGANTYTGLTTVENADLRIGNGGTTGSLVGNISSDSFVTFNRSDSYTYGGTLSGSGTVRQNGAGTLILTGSNSYTGGTDVNAGTLLANNGSGSATGSGAVLVLSGATLGGDGSISGSVTINSGGFLAPGSSTGDLTVGNVTFQAGSTFLVELGGLTPGTQHDRLNVTSAASLNGTLDVSLFGGFVPNIGDTFTILSAGNRAGTFTSIVTQGFDASVAYNGNQVTLTVTAIPEPAAAAVLGLAVLGGGGAWWWRRRNRQVDEELDAADPSTA